MSHSIDSTLYTQAGWVGGAGILLSTKAPFFSVGLTPRSKYTASHIWMFIMVFSWKPLTQSHHTQLWWDQRRSSQILSACQRQDLSTSARISMIRSKCMRTLSMCPRTSLSSASSCCLSVFQRATWSSTYDCIMTHKPQKPLPRWDWSIAISFMGRKAAQPNKRGNMDIVKASGMKVQMPHRQHVKQIPPNSN